MQNKIAIMIIVLITIAVVGAIRYNKWQIHQMDEEYRQWSADHRADTNLLRDHPDEWVKVQVEADHIDAVNREVERRRKR